jgi:hypothetical protein
MQIIKHDINIDFVGKRKLAMIISGVVILLPELRHRFCRWNPGSG